MKMFIHTWNIRGMSLASARMTSPWVTDRTWNTLLKYKKKKKEIKRHEKLLIICFYHRFVILYYLL